MGPASYRIIPGGVISGLFRGAQFLARQHSSNGLDQIQQVLARDFAGRPVTEQNLSEWKQGGFFDWRQEMESSARLRDPGFDPTKINPDQTKSK